MLDRGLVQEWRSSIGHLSRIGQITSLPSYRDIVNLGDRATPLLLRELRRQPDHFFTALRELTGAQPITHDDRGRLKNMARAWIDWGLANRRF
jgi:hypothetical protein